ncbi:uncharacterized protein LOC135151175 [Daucus carota subsp. sativus]|uniref:uncharacterized protein LOC135151175 n=1 Tax=Daucus carota subsp. sativus TaxID=79200 RepID=UPI003082D4B4
MPPAPQPQSQPQPQHPVSPTVTRKPRSSTPKPSKSTKSDAPSTKKTRTSVATQVLKTKSDKPVNSDAVNSDVVHSDPVNSEVASPQKQKRRRLVAAYDYDDLDPAHEINSEPSPATNSENIQTSPQTKPARFKRRANKAKRTRVPITEITDFTVEEEQAPPTTTPDDLSQALMVLPLQAVPISAATASSTSSEVDEEIICKEKATDEAETPVSDCNNPISDHGPSTPIPHSPMKIPEGAIVHDTAPENYKSDVVDESDKVALEALQSLAKAGEEPSKSQSEAQDKSAKDPIEKVDNPASDNDEDDESSDDDNDDNDDEVPLSHLQQKWESTSQYNARLQILDTTSEPLPRDLQVDPPNEDLTKHKNQLGSPDHGSFSGFSQEEQSCTPIPSILPDCVESSADPCPAEHAVYPNIDNVISCFMTTRVISMLENHQNYSNNEQVVLPEAMQEFLNNQNLPPPHVQHVAVPVVAEEVSVQQDEPETEPIIQDNIPEAQTTQVEEDIVIMEDAAEDSSEREVQSEEGEDSLQDNTTDSEDEVDSPVQTTEAATNDNVMLDIDELFTNTYNPVLQSGIPSDSDNLSFSAPDDWVQNLLDLNPLSPPLAHANEFEIPQIHNQGTNTQISEAETSQPLSHPIKISEREGESALSAPHKEVVSESAALSPSQERRMEP